MITLCVFDKKGDDKPIITYVGNFAFKLHKGTLFVFGVSEDYDQIACKELEQWNDNMWYAYVEV